MDNDCRCKYIMITRGLLISLFKKNRINLYAASGRVEQWKMMWAKTFKKRLLGREKTIDGDNRLTKVLREEDKTDYLRSAVSSLFILEGKPSLISCE